MDVLIERLDGQRKRFSELGLIPRDFLVSTAEIRPYASQLTGRPGNIDKGADYGPKSISVPFMFEVERLEDFGDKRDEIYEWLGGKEKFYLYEGRSTVEGRFEVPGESTGKWEYGTDIDYRKRYLVRRTTNLAPNQVDLWGLDEISFSTVELPFAESSDMARASFENPASIVVFNKGNEAVDPEEGMELLIRYTGVSENLSIRNETNGTEWNCQVTSASEFDEITIEGVHSQMNLLSIVRNTNLGLVKLEPGRNDITVEGATAGTLAFHFREYYR